MSLYDDAIELLRRRPDLLPAPPREAAGHHLFIMPRAVFYGTPEQQEGWLRDVRRQVDARRRINAEDA